MQLRISTECKPFELYISNDLQFVSGYNLYNKTVDVFSILYLSKGGLLLLFGLCHFVFYLPNECLDEMVHTKQTGIGQ